MEFDDFVKSVGQPTDEQRQRIVDELRDSLKMWLVIWGDLYQIPQDKRFGAFLNAVGIGYRMALRDAETDKLNKLLS